MFRRSGGGAGGCVWVAGDFTAVNEVAKGERSAASFTLGNEFYGSKSPALRGGETKNKKIPIFAALFFTSMVCFSAHYTIVEMGEKPP